MKNLKVKLLAGSHPLYQELIDFPPKGIKYDVATSSEDTLKHYKFLGIAKRFAADTALKAFNLPRVFFVSTDADLIHSTRGLIILNKKPWVVDIEYARSFVGNRHDTLLNPDMQRRISKYLSSEYCKKIMPHCYAASKSMNSIFGKKFNNKTEVVYPAIRKSKKYKKTKSDSINIFFYGRNRFFLKGGKETLEAFSLLQKKYDVTLTMKADVPTNYREKYPNVIYEDRMLPKEQFFKKIFSQADVFCFPSFMDTFGFVLLEAMSLCLPVVATDIFAMKEIVENNKGGFIIKSPITWHNNKYLFKWNSMKEYAETAKREYPEMTKQLYTKLEDLILNDNLRRKMGNFNRKLVEKGKFSIKERNKKLRRIYEEAVK
jgi:glycosyltransferase involved in cell wall biosynthesis